MTEFHTFVVLVPTEDNGLVAPTSGQFTETQRRAIEHMARNAGVTPPTPALRGLAADSGMGIIGTAMGAGAVLRAPVLPVGYAGDGVVVAPVPTKSQKYAAARSQGYTGDACTTCQGMSVKRNGACLVCESCGSTTGCS